MVNQTRRLSLKYPDPTDPVKDGYKSLADIAKQADHYIDDVADTSPSSRLYDVVHRLSKAEQSMRRTTEQLPVSGGYDLDNEEYDDVFTLYNGEYPIELVRSGNVVTISGALTTTHDLDKQTMFTIPKEHRPSVDLSPGNGDHYGTISQGSYGNKWRWFIKASGEVKAERYGPNSQTDHVWMPFVITYTIGDNES